MPQVQPVPFGLELPPIHTGRAMPVLGKLETAQAIILGETGIIPTSGKRPAAGGCPLPNSDAFASTLPLAGAAKASTASWRSARSP